MNWHVFFSELQKHQPYRKLHADKFQISTERSSAALGNDPPTAVAGLGAK